jgi:hypothetical protein
MLGKLCRMKRDYRRSGRGRKRSSLALQLRQLGDVGGDAPRLVLSEQLGRGASSRLLLEIDVGERLPVGVADDEAPPVQLGVGFFVGAHACGVAL